MELVTPILDSIGRYQVAWWCFGLLFPGVAGMIASLIAKCFGKNLLVIIGVFLIAYISVLSCAVKFGWIPINKPSQIQKINADTNDPSTSLSLSTSPANGSLQKFSADGINSPPVAQTHKFEGVPINIHEGGMVSPDVSIGVATPSTLAVNGFRLKNDSPIDLVVTKRAGANQLLVTVKNNQSEIPANARKFLGVVRFGENGDKLQWYENADGTPVPQGEARDFGFNIDEQEMYVTFYIQIKGVENDILMDQNHTGFFTDMWFLPAKCYGFPEALSYTTENGATHGTRANNKINKFKDCMQKHSSSRDYSACLER